MIKKILKLVLPNFFLKIYKNLSLKIERNKFSKMTTKKVFKKIYEKNYGLRKLKKKNLSFTPVVAHIIKIFQKNILMK